MARNSRYAPESPGGHEYRQQVGREWALRFMDDLKDSSNSLRRELDDPLNPDQLVSIQDIRNHPSIRPYTATYDNLARPEIFRQVASRLVHPNSVLEHRFLMIEKKITTAMQSSFTHDSDTRFVADDVRNTALLLCLFGEFLATKNVQYPIIVATKAHEGRKINLTNPINCLEVAASKYLKRR